MVKFVFFIVISFVLGSCKSSVSSERISVCSTDNMSKGVKTSFKEVTAGKVNREQVVELTGVFQYNFEDVAIYSDKGDKAAALWVNFNENIDNRSDSLLHRLSGRKVRVTGKINLLDKGHMSAYAGSMDSVFCITEVK